MLPSQMPRQPFDAQDELTAAVMTNAELADAIRYAFETCSQTYTGGYQSRDAEAGKVMLAHLKELTATQAKRAALFIAPPNVGGERPGNPVRSTD